MQGCASVPRPSHIDGAHLTTFGGATFYVPDDAPVYQDSNYAVNKAIRTINSYSSRSRHVGPYRHYSSAEGRRGYASRRYR